MANVSITDEANEALDRYVESSEYGATKKDVTSSVILDFVEAELEDQQ